VRRRAGRAGQPVAVEAEGHAHRKVNRSDHLEAAGVEKDKVAAIGNCVVDESHQHPDDRVLHAIVAAERIGDRVQLGVRIALGIRGVTTMQGAVEITGPTVSSASVNS
jgi:hypothetical protein